MVSCYLISVTWSLGISSVSFGQLQVCQCHLVSRYLVSVNCWILFCSILIGQLFLVSVNWSVQLDQFFWSVLLGQLLVGELLCGQSLCPLLFGHSHLVICYLFIVTWLIVIWSVLLCQLLIRQCQLVSCYFVSVTWSVVIWLVLLGQLFFGES